MKLKKTLRLPREHGAWAMLYVPFAAGVLVAGKVNWGVALLLVATTAVFISRESLVAWLRAESRGRDAGGARRAALVYLALAAAGGLPLLLFYQLYWLAPLALAGAVLLAVNGKQGLEMEDRSIKGELLAIAAMSLTGPAAYYAASRSWDATAFWLWALSAVYFASSVFYIKLRVLRLNPRRAEAARQVSHYSASYHLAVLAALAALAAAGQLHLFAVAAFAPVIARALWSLAQPAKKVNLKRAGVLELAYSIIFLVFVTLNFRSG
jgi:hypothetical protein